jgi:hypothetical protein
VADAMSWRAGVNLKQGDVDRRLSFVDLSHDIHSI